MLLLKKSSMMKRGERGKKEIGTEGEVPDDKGTNCPDKQGPNRFPDEQGASRPATADRHLEGGKGGKREGGAEKQRHEPGWGLPLDRRRQAKGHTRGPVNNRLRHGSLQSAGQPSPGPTRVNRKRGGGKPGGKPKQFLPSRFNDTVDSKNHNLSPRSPDHICGV